jgi:hypothetical protein
MTPRYVSAIHITICDVFIKMIIYKCTLLIVYMRKVCKDMKKKKKNLHVFGCILQVYPICFTAAFAIININCPIKFQFHERDRHIQC